MLPEGFRWEQRYQYDKGRSALTLNGAQVAFLVERSDRGWSARLWVHHGLHVPIVMRRCTSYETGKAGIELWALRHVERLRREVGKR